MEARLCLLLTLLSTLKVVAGLTITVSNANGSERFRYSDDNAAWEGRSYFLPGSEDHRLKGHLLSPGQGSSLCDPIAAVNVNLSLIAYVNTFYNACPFFVENNIYKAGYAAMIVYTLDPNSNFNPVTDLPQAMFSRRNVADYLDSVLGANFTYNEDLFVEVWDDSARLVRLFIIFGSVLLVAVLLAVVLFCGTFICRAVIYKWRTRGLTRWQIRRLPRRKYRKAKETTETCSICLEDFKEGSTIRVLPCEHIYHPKCVDEWLQKWNRTCPLCKSTIKRSKGAARIDPDETSGLLSEGGVSSARASFNDEPDYGATTHLLEPASNATSPSNVEMGLSANSPETERSFHTPAPISEGGDTLSYQTADEGQ